MQQQSPEPAQQTVGTLSAQRQHIKLHVRVRKMREEEVVEEEGVRGRGTSGADLATFHVHYTPRPLDLREQISSPSFFVTSRIGNFSVPGCGVLNNCEKSCEES